MQAVICFFFLSSFSCYFTILRGVFFFSSNCCIYGHVFQLVVHGLATWDSLYPPAFSLRKKGLRINVVLAIHA